MLVSKYLLFFNVLRDFSSRCVKPFLPKLKWRNDSLQDNVNKVVFFP